MMKKTSLQPQAHTYTFNTVLVVPVNKALLQISLIGGVIELTRQCTQAGQRGQLVQLLFSTLLVCSRALPRGKDQNPQLEKIKLDVMQEPGKGRKRDRERKADDDVT